MRVAQDKDFVGKVEGGGGAPTRGRTRCTCAVPPRLRGGGGGRGGLAPRVQGRAALACRGMARRRPECLTRIRVLADPQG